MFKIRPQDIAPKLGLFHFTFIQLKEILSKLFFGHD